MSNAINSTMATSSRCPLSTVTLLLASSIFVCGVLGNALVMIYVQRERQAKKKPNMLLLFHMALNNLLALMASLPLHVVIAEFIIIPNAALPVILSNLLCVTRTLSSYVFVKVGLLMLAGICVDRYEMFIKLRKPKILTSDFTKRFVVGSWLTAILSSVCVSYGYILNALQPWSYCDHHPGLEEQRITIHGKISNVLVVIDIAIWILICNLVNVYTLLKVWHVLRKHFEAVKITLGHSKILRELRLVKMAAYVFAAYFLLWLPYGLSRVLLLTIGYRSNVVACFHKVYKTITYTIFAVIPFIYIGTNKTILRQTLRMICKPSRNFRPQSIILVAWSTIGRGKPKENNAVNGAASNAVNLSFSVEI